LGQRSLPFSNIGTSNIGADFQNTHRSREIVLGNPLILRTMKALSTILMIVFLAASAEAKLPRPAQVKRDKAAEKREQQEREAREKKHDTLQKYLDQKDGNHDGSLSLEEFLTGEADKAAAEKKFAQYNKNGDRLLSKSEIEELLGLEEHPAHPAK
jgi:hypothetical protein